MNKFDKDTKTADLDREIDDDTEYDDEEESDETTEKGVAIG